MGLVAMSRLPPGEAERRRKARVARSFSPAGYKHFNPEVSGYGSEAEWQEAAERMASGRGAYRIPEGETAAGQAGPRRRVRITPDMRALGLEEMPEHVRGLVSAFRRAALRAHPDTGGTGAEFIAVRAAYERLLRSY
jgi:hypothetical protein